MTIGQGQHIIDEVVQNLSQMKLRNVIAGSDWNIFVNTYSGLGDAIVCGPILSSLNKRYPGRIFYIENSILMLYRTLRVDNLLDIRVIGRELRRFVDLQLDELLQIFKSHNIKFIFNLRRDRTIFKETYESLAQTIKRSGLYLTDVCEKIPVSMQNSLHTFDLNLQYFRRIGLELEGYQLGWLRKSARGYDLNSAQPDGVGIYLGAGQSIKRMPLEFWRNVIRRTLATKGWRVSLMCGINKEELEEGKQLSQKLRDDGINHELLSDLSLKEIVIKVSRCKFIISGDTFMVHLAEALGVKVIGVYCSTSSKVYGPYNPQNLSLQSSFYWQCPLRNQVGNCDGWELGCISTPCKKLFSLDIAIGKIIEFLSQ